MQGFPRSVHLLLKATHFPQLHKKKPNPRMGVPNTGCAGQARWRDQCCESTYTRHLERSGAEAESRMVFTSGMAGLDSGSGKRSGWTGTAGQDGTGGGKLWKANVASAEWGAQPGEPRVSIWREESRRLTGCGSLGTLIAEPREVAVTLASGIQTAVHWGSREGEPT